MPPIWKKDPSLEELNELCKHTLCEALGIEFYQKTFDSLTARMPVEKKTQQTRGILHGGASAALAETVASVAANYCVDKGKTCVGIELNINHMRAVQKGWIFATAKALHLGKTTQVWEIRIENEAEQLVAVARLTLAVLTKD